MEGSYGLLKKKKKNNRIQIELLKSRILPLSQTYERVHWTLIRVLQSQAFTMFQQNKYSNSVILLQTRRIYVVDIILCSDKVGEDEMRYSVSLKTSSSWTWSVKFGSNHARESSSLDLTALSHSLPLSSQSVSFTKPSPHCVNSLYTCTTARCLVSTRHYIIISHRFNFQLASR